LNPNIPANANFKDSFFTKLFSEPESILNLYNALAGSNYAPGTPVEITTLENVLYRGRYNDLSFIIDGKLVVLVEHQASVNPNMPLRLLIYLAKVYDRHIRGRNIYSSRQVKIPRPEFIVLYNGTGDFPEEAVLKLSDLFFDLPEGHKQSGSLELTVRVLNINKGHNEAIVHESTELDGYVVMVDEIRKNRESGMSLEDAVARAVRDCAGRNILTEFLRRYGGEVINMLYTEWNWDEYIAVQRREAAEDAAKAAAKATAKKILAGGLSPEDAAEFTGRPIEEVKALARNNRA
jgi:hypothetical protein